MSEYIKNVTEAIEAVHECRATHFGTEHVCEVYGAETVWEGDVEIFQLEGHPEATLAYGWGWDGIEGEIDYIGIINVPPVDSATTAVRAALISGQFS